MAFNRRAKFGVAALVGAAFAALIALWSYREPIARSALDDYLAARGVEASYKIKAIETRRQRFEAVRLGPADHPDLTADWLEVDVGPSLTGVSVKAVRAGGVRLRGEVSGKKISLGTLDRLLPAASDAPFRLPNIDLSLEDARARLESPWGAMGFRLDGQGNLRAGFEGKLAGVAPRLSTASCAADRVTLYGDVSVVGGRPSFAGPVRANRLGCGDVRAEAGDIMLEASLAEDLSNWRGDAKAQLARLTLRQASLQGASAALSANGASGKTEARFDLDVNAAQLGEVTALRTHLAGKALLGPKGISVRGAVRSGRLSSPVLGQIAADMAGAADAPVVGPLSEKLALSVRHLGAGVAAQADFSMQMIGGKSSLSLGRIALAGGKGARLEWPAPDAVQITQDGLRLMGRVRFGGGGLPAGRAEFAGQTGLVQWEPYRAGRAAVRLAPTRLALRPSGVDVATRAVFDGPIGTGWVRGLSVPIRLKAGQGLAAGCSPLGVQALRFGDMRFGQGTITACVEGNSIRLIRPALRGRAGAFPVRLGAASLSYQMAQRRLALVDARLRQGDPKSPTEIHVSRLTGRLENGQLVGTIAGAGGMLSGVALRVSDAQGSWRFASGRLRFQGETRVADSLPSPRFFPLVADDIQLQLRDRDLSATARLREPKSGVVLSQVAVTHDLGKGQGNARLDLDQLRFGPGLQPEAITPVTLGVVANVYGAISGQGQISWTADTLTSSGQFQTQGLDFAGAFGPVTGFAGEVVFADLLALVTAPHQALRVASINPGVLVTEGQIRYRLLPGYRVQVEGGRWPFAGGTLRLDPTVLDMSEAAERRLTFRVEGLDAARFISAMGFENIAATGVYDGVLPMVFDASGGRIEGGKLVARGGGTLSYVGQVSNENLGLMGRVAFDALKSMRYSRLELDLNGAVDGDVITKISFAGVNLAPVAGGRSKLPVKLLGASNLPFVFNVTVSAKFRSLFDMARTLGDPSGRISDWVSANQPQKPVQPAESDPKR